MHLLCKLIGFDDKQMTKEARNREEKSSAMWKFEIDRVLKPSKKSFIT